MVASAALATTTVTTLDGSQGWSKTDVRPGGTADIVDLTGTGGNLENNQPLPDGALKLTTDATNAAKAEVGYGANLVWSAASWTAISPCPTAGMIRVAQLQPRRSSCRSTTRLMPVMGSVR
jgi:hypothetical protein